MLLFCCLPFLVCTALLRGQAANNTSLVGTVTDSTGGVVANAHVTGVNRATKVAYTGDTNGEGYYSIPFIAPGTYDVSVELTGFKKTTASGVLVTINLAVRTDVMLTLGDAATEVTVSADTAALSTDDAMLGETIDTGKVENLPMNGRHALDLAATASNITVSTTNPFLGNPPGESAIGAGTRAVNNSLTLDGISIMNNLGSTSAVSPNPDSLEAVQTQNGNYPAQYGSYMGVHINMVTKSGTNQIHGTVYDYIQNDALNAKAWLTAPGGQKSSLRYNQFGGVVSGPVVIPFLYNGRDKTFFMASYEGLRDTFGTLTTGTVMTAAMRNGDFSALLDPAQVPRTVKLMNPFTRLPYAGNIIPIDQISPQAQRVFQYLSLPTQTGKIANNFNANVPSTINMNQSVDRIDHNFGEKIRIFVRYDWQKVDSVSGAINPSSNAYSPTASRNGTIGYTHTLTPNLVNDFRYGYNILTTQQLNFFAKFGPKDAGSQLGIPGFTADVTNDNPGLPSINITGYQGTNGEDGSNWFQDDRTLQGYDQISYARGKHSYMAGIDIRKLTIGRAAQNGPRGTFTFSGTYTGTITPTGIVPGDGAADFFLGAAQSDMTPFFQIKGSVGQYRDGFFVQDTWLILPKLTLTYGLRYELPTVAYSLNGNGRVLNSDYTALIPASTATTATAYTPVPGFKFTNPNHNDWAPRFGFAYRATDKVVVRGGGGIYYNANHLNGFTLASTNYPFSASVAYNGVTAPAAPNVTFATPTPGAGVTTPVAGTPNSYVSAFTDNPHLPTPRLYQWNLDVGTELWKNAGFELQYLGSRGIHLDESFYPNQPQPGAGNVNARRPFQLFGQIRQIQNDSFSTYQGLTAILRQRVTHGLSMNLGYTWSHALDTSADSNGGGSAMFQGHLKLDYGNSNWDMTHRFVGVVTYALPELNTRSLLVRETLGGWQANSIVTLQTGLPINVTIATDIANAGNVGGPQRPNFVHIAHMSCDRDAVVARGNKGCLDATAYAQPSAFTYGNLHRNDVHGPGYENVNLSVFKNFAIVENVKFQFRLEGFNIFNHPSPANPAAGDLALGGSSFGSITLVQGAARVLQLAGKINF
nr:TonB-dependent receptor [Granulicella sp. dw_53]